MFDIHNYNPKEYEKERKNRLAHKEKIVQEMEEETTSQYENDKEESSSGKKVLFGLVLGTVGIVGYLGFSYLQSEPDQSQQNPVATVINNSTELNSSNQKEIKQELTTTAPSTQAEEEKEQTSTLIPTSITTTPPVLDSNKREIVTTVTPKSIKDEGLNVTNIHNEEKKTKIESVPKIVKQEPVVTPAPIIIKEISDKKRESEPKKVEKKKVVKKAKREIIIEKRERRMVTVRKGDTLASISKRFYGNSMKFDKIIKANRRIKSKSTSLRLGERLCVPRLNKSRERRMITVRRGDTLAIIAKEFYGDSKKYKRIIRANYNIKSTTTPLHIGQKIHVPR